MSEIYKHRVTHGQQVWAMIDGSPQHVEFEGLLPYQGFAYAQTGESKETSNAAIFADSLDSLLDAHIWRHESDIAELRAKVDALNAMRAHPTPAHGEGRG